MTQHRDIGRVLDHWLAEGSTVAPDRVVDVVTDRIERERQRPAWLPSRREPIMSTQLRIAAAVAVVAILGAGAVYLRGLGPDVGSPSGGSPSGDPPTVSPPPPSASRSPNASVGPAAGLRRVTSRIRPTFVLDIPSGWEEWFGGTWYSVQNSADPGPFRVSITFMRYTINPGDPLRCDEPAETAGAPVVAALIEALVADPRVATTSRGSVTVGSHAGEFVDIHLSPAATGTCPDGARDGAAFAHSLPSLESIGRHRLILVDVDGAVLEIRISGSDEASFDAAVAEAMPIVGSLQFTP